MRLFALMDRMEIHYAVGGSVASSVYGISRPTMDLDIVTDLRIDQVEEFAQLLGPEFYADIQMMKEGIERGRSFNLIHYPTTFKIDLFPLKHDLYSEKSFERRQYGQSRSFGTEPVECMLATAEDTVLRKLEWYRLGGETSERQWNDLRGILQVNRARLDCDYLRKWAPQLKVDDLLQKLLAE